MLTALVVAAGLLGPVRVPVPCSQEAVPREVGSQEAGSQEAEVRELQLAIEQLRDEVPVDVLESLAEMGTREAAEALIAGYDELASILMHREVVYALARFDGIGGAEQLALQKIADVATGESAPELHEEAVDVLAGCPSLGRFFLRAIVDSPAAASVRERAMLRHVETSDGGTDDLDWYEQLFYDTGELTKKEKQAKETVGRPRPLIRIRELALEQVAPGMKDARLVDLAREKRRDAQGASVSGIRRLALAELMRRESRKARSVAEEMFKDVTESATNRIAAARALYALQGEKLAGRFLSEGDRDPSVVPMALRMAMADMLAEMDSESTDRKLVALLKKGDDETALFCLRALRGFEDERLLAELLQLLGDDNPRVRLAAIEALGVSASPAAVEALQELLEGDMAERLLVAAIDSLTGLRGSDPAWAEQLSALATGERDELRNAALRRLADCDRAGYAEVFFGALSHEDWSTRVTALEVLTDMRTREATAAIVERMGDESGFMLNHFAEALWSLSGQPFGRSASTWQRWWSDVGANFEPITLAELARLADDLENRRLRESTKVAIQGASPKVSFFGVRVESKRVLFILDTSGSMSDSLYGGLIGSFGEVRMDVAKRELVAAISGLQADTVFNLITFSGGVGYWQRGGVAVASASSKEEAIEYVSRLGSGGGTNMYGALKEAFRDRDVDTIFLLSDGEPSVGEVVDPYVIRDEVASWNEHRHVTLHTVAIGGSLDVLEWLAEDSGGRYVKFE